MAASWTAAIDALFGIATVALPGVQQAEGELGTYVADEQFTIADVIGEDEAATSGVPRRYNEAYGITCEVRTYAGNIDPVARRARVVAMYEAFRTELEADPSLDGTVIESRCTNYRYAAGTTDKGGWEAQVEFTVHVNNQTVT